MAAMRPEAERSASPSDEVQDSSEGSFPASDAPSWSTLHAGSPAPRPAPRAAAAPTMPFKAKLESSGDTDDI